MEMRMNRNPETGWGRDFDKNDLLQDQRLRTLWKDRDLTELIRRLINDEFREKRQ